MNKFTKLINIYSIIILSSIYLSSSNDKNEITSSCPDCSKSKCDISWYNCKNYPKCIPDCPDCEKDSDYRIYDQSSFIKTLAEFEIIVNNKLPTIADYIKFNRGHEDPYERNMSCDSESWKTLQHWGFAQEDFDLINKKRPQNDDKVPSCWLIKMQRAITKKNKKPIEIYLPARFRNCYEIMQTTDCPLLAIDVNAIIKVGTEYKTVIYKLPCNEIAFDLYGRIIDININNKWLESNIWEEPIKHQ